MEKLEGEIWCDVHGCTHAETNDPYDYCYALAGEEPECDRPDWHILWIGAIVPKGKK